MPFGRAIALAKLEGEINQSVIGVDGQVLKKVLAAKLSLFYKKGQAEIF